MRVLCIGDVVSLKGCEFLRQKLPLFKKENNIDVVIVNGENSADGNGITPTSAKYLLDSGVDAVTTGNHVFKRPEFLDYLEQSKFVIRPANYPNSAPGTGMCYIDLGYTRVAVINLLGTVGLEALDNPFYKVDLLIDRAKKDDIKIIIVDFHAEATAEKKALGFYLDGKVSAVFGTHTHVQTADAQILPNGTGYITDVGMTGPYLSVLGIDPQNAIKKLREHLPVRFSYADSPCFMQGVLFDIDKGDGKCTQIKSINIL